MGGFPSRSNWRSPWELEEDCSTLPWLETFAGTMVFPALQLWQAVLQLNEEMWAPASSIGAHVKVPGWHLSNMAGIKLDGPEVHPGLKHLLSKLG